MSHAFAGYDRWKTHTPEATFECERPGCTEGDEDSLVNGLCARHTAEYYHDEPLPAHARVEGARVVIELDTTGYAAAQATAILHWAQGRGITPVVGVLIDAWSEAERRGVGR